MLTGDKIETAKCVGISCKLISRGQGIFLLSSQNQLQLLQQEDEMENSAENSKQKNSLAENNRYDYQIKNFLRSQIETFSNQKDTCLITEGSTLGQILADPDLEKNFFFVASQAPCVICSRCSPTQKAEIVKMIKKYTPMATTAAIGDGGNDVSMIQEAHLGVGIVGKEGKKKKLSF